MLQRLEVLRSEKCNNIDAMSIAPLSMPEDLATPIIASRAKIAADLPPEYRAELQHFLLAHESLQDHELVRRLAETFTIDNFPANAYAAEGLLISKVNHGFWEHFAYMHASPGHRTTYRDVNLPLRENQYLTGDFLDVLTASMLGSLPLSSIDRFVSCTTGVQTFSDCLGAPWASGTGNFENYKLSDFKRGAVRGLLAFAHLHKMSSSASQVPLRFHDSYSNNKSFEDGILLDTLCRSANEDTVCLIMGPERLGGVRVTNWPGRHAFLCLSGNHAQAQWRFNLVNLLSVLKHYDTLDRRVVVLFQGAVLGPLLVRFLADFIETLTIKVSFLDLGRLLDIAYEADISKTGSPLPNRSFDSKNMLNIVECGDTIFQEA